jgi:hypothetical protein
MVTASPRPQPPTVHPPARAATHTDDTTVAALVAAVSTDGAGIVETMDWAEDEIAKAVRRHPDQADALYHAFDILRPRPIGPGMTSEFVYRSHAAELLERVAAGTDTTAATAAELCLVCAQTSQLTPMHGAAAGLYFRLWRTAFPGHPSTRELADQQVHYESLFGSVIDELEHELRGTCADPSRRLNGVDCSGRHHGQPVTCRYATTPADADPRPRRRLRRRRTTPASAAEGTPPASPGITAPGVS